MNKIAPICACIFLATTLSVQASEKGSMKENGMAKAEMAQTKKASGFSDDEVYMVIEKQLDKKAEFTGKVDIYDSAEDKVRHLNLVKIHEGITQDNNLYTARVEFTDDQTREIVFLNVSVEDKDGLITFGSLALAEVQPAPAIEKKEWNDDDIMATMRDFIDEKAKISGTVDIFDSSSQKVLNLEFVEFAGEIRRFGKLFIATANMKDRTSKKVFAVDVTAENKDNELTLKSIRLKK